MSSRLNDIDIVNLKWLRGILKPKKTTIIAGKTILLFTPTLTEYFCFPSKGIQHDTLVFSKNRAMCFARELSERRDLHRKCFVTHHPQKSCLRLSRCGLVFSLHPPKL